MYTKVKRATVARTALDSIAAVCLGASGAFWFSLYYAVLSPPALLSRQTVIVGAMGLVYTLVLPLLWSILVPSTPAGMLLQKTQHGTWGFIVVIPTALYLTWHGGTLLRVWWMAQPYVVESNQDLPLTISCLIAFVLVPALAWTQVTPERWLAQVQQAHLVRKIEVMHAADIALAKTAYLRSLKILSAGLSNATAAERQEVVGTLKALHLAQNDTLLAIAGTFKEIAGIEYRVPNEFDDMSIATRCEEVARTIEGVVVTINDNHPLSNDRQLSPGYTASETVASVAPNMHESDPRSAGTIPDHHIYLAAQAALGSVWTINDLAAALRIEESTARKLKASWEQVGLVRGAGLKGRYSFTESE
jgi:hypothetical protein